MNLEEMTVRIVPHKKDNAASSLAIDRALLKVMEQDLVNGENPNPIIRTYQFNKPAVIMGYNQKIDGRFNFDLAENYGIDLTVRDTGGGHMYFSKDDIQFAFIGPNSLLGKDLIGNYHKINSIIVDALNKIGYDAILGRTSIKLNQGEKLIAGTARRHANKAFLHQGGIMVRRYDDLIFDLLMARDDEKKQWTEKVMSLEETGINESNKLPQIIKTLFPSSQLSDLSERETFFAKQYYQNTYSNIEKIKSGEKDGDVCLIAGERSTKHKEQEIII
jgi:lipoyl(octanoyl) transferase